MPHAYVDPPDKYLMETRGWGSTLWSHVVGHLRRKQRGQYGTEKGGVVVGTHWRVVEAVDLH